MELVTLLGSLALGVALAASAGLRAFLPLFVLGVFARFGWVDLGEAFEWLSHTPALLALGVGVGLELSADKVPLVNHLLDAIQTPVRTVAGMLVFAAPIVELPIWVVALLAIIIGGGTALAVHVAKSGLRVGSTAATGGAASPVHSALEDVVCLLTSALSILVGLVALVLAAVGLVVFFQSARVVYRRLTR